MKTSTIRERSGLESIADEPQLQRAIKLLQKQGYAIIDPDTLKRASEAFETSRRMEAREYRRYMSDPASYNHQ